MEEYFHSNLLAEAGDLLQDNPHNNGDNNGYHKDYQNGDSHNNQNNNNNNSSQNENHSNENISQHKHFLNDYNKSIEVINSSPPLKSSSFIHSWDDFRPEDVQSIMNYYSPSNQSQHDNYLHNWQRKFQPTNPDITELHLPSHIHVKSPHYDTKQEA